ncbi:uncharacterized protein LOC126735729 [Anthonomus grandis grandis]|uniref:uncharacterized protein LOC126735729 n=1 Tax=Anthonomus grandis grandis TaxID=2921223 RepID=UPI002166AB8C|nr:uncharacterized protein LOC126735729 [Anthonomus grandis grandis]
MLILTVVLAILHSACIQGIDLMQECAKLYRPKNYLDILPSLNMPYVDQLAIPNNVFKNKHYQNMIKNILPTPVVTTKVLQVKTKYVYKNPICVKYSKKQKLCKPEDGRIRENVDNLITKESFIKEDLEENVEAMVDVEDSEEDDAERFTLKVSFNKLEPSEPTHPQEARAFRYPTKLRTPTIEPPVHVMLIEDRLDQLETLIPGYQRRRIYETSTIYVTKTISNHRNMATLVVKNCVPYGYDVCSPKSKKRKSKIAKRTFNLREREFYYG